MASTQIGVVQSLQGQVSVTHDDGASEQLQEGSKVFLNDVVTTGNQAAVLISFLDGSEFEIGPAFTAILNTEVFDPSGYLVAGETTGEAVTVSHIGEVTGIEGDVRVVRADGTTQSLSVGDFLYANDFVITAAESSAAAKMLDGSVMDFGPDFTAYINDDLFPSRYPDYVQAGLTDAEIIRAAILAGQDPADVGKAPAAGAEVTEDAGNSIVVIEDRGRQVTPESGHETTGLGYGFSEMEELLQTQRSVPPIGDDSTVLEALDEALIEHSLDAPPLNFTAGTSDIVSFSFGDLSGITVNTDGIAGADVEWVQVNATTLEGYVNDELALTLTLSGDPIAAESTGGVTVTGTLTDNFLHEAGDGANSIVIEGLEVVATDTADASATGAVSVIVTDDVPSVDVLPDAADSIEEGATTSGTWIGDGGADGIASSVVYLNGNDSTTYALDEPITVINAGGDELGVLRVSSDGSWTFNAALDVNNTDEFADALDFTVRVTDGDGDVAEDTHSIAVGDDGLPSGGSTTLEALDEAAITDSLGAPLSFTAGSDALVSFKFSDDLSGMTVDTDGIAGDDVEWTRVSDTLIEGRVDGELALTLELSGTDPIAAFTTGSVTITGTLTENFIHPDADGANTLTISGLDVVATDTDGTTATGAVSVVVADDVPTAQVDVGAVNEGDILTVVADGVLGNDEFGADGAVLVGVRAAGGDTTTDAVGQVGTTIDGVYGTLNLSSDGGYTYTSTDNGIEGNETDVFVYTIEDGDGDLSTTTLTINLTDGGLVAGEADEVLVDEAALDLAQTGADLVPGTVTGSLPGSAAETDASQTLTDNVTGGFNGDSSNYSYALVGSATGTYGTIQVNADGSYIYTLSAPVDGATADDGTNTVDNAESFTYEVTDEVGNTAQGTIQINIADDVPTAQVDVGAVNEGDILTVVADGVLGNDEFGADGAVLVGVRAAGGDTTTDAVGQVGTTIDGVYGTLNLSSDGGYTYTSTDNGIEGNETDVFVYTIEDGDGDLSTTTLTINLTDGGLVAGEADEVLVDEAALDLAQTGADLVPGTVTGSLPGSAAETDASQTLTDNVTGGFNGDSSNYSYALVGSATGTYGTIQVNADGSYIYTLSAPVDGATADDGTNTVDNAESFTYEVTDEVGNTAQGTIQINIADDVPTAQVDVGAVNEGDILTVVADGVLGNDEFGADGAVLVGVRAAGGDTTTDAVGQVGTTIDGVYGTLNLSSDGGYTYTSTDNGIEGNETDVFVYTIEDGDGDLSTTTLTINLTDGGLVAGEADEVLVDEAALDLAQTGADLVPGTVTGSLPGSAAETDASQTLTDNVTGGFNGDSSNYSYALVGSATGTYGTIQVNADGSYIYTLSAPVDGATADDGTNTVDNAESFTYEVTDEVGNTAQGTIQINIADDVPTAQVDVGAVNEGDILTVVADGVLGNDEFGADGAVLVGVRAAGGDTTTDAVGQVGTTIDGVYGTLNLSSDGGYTYTSTDNGIEGNETDVFVYTIEDGDGDLSTTTLTINLTDGGLVAGEADEVLVDEAALDLAQTGADLVPGTVTGSLPGSAAETDASQTLTDNVTGGFNGDSSNYSYALVGSATGTYGTIQVNADGSYIYTLSAPVDGATADDGTNTVDNAESFTYEVTDEVGNTAQGTIQINIADDVPTAQVDVGAVNEGDILTVVADGVLGNDEFGADGAVLVGVRAAGGDTTTDAVGQVGTTIDGVYGTLNLSSDGGYTYTSTDNGIEGNETDVFVYTIEDGDGDLSTTTLTINLTDGGLVAGEADEVLVDEAALDLAQTGADLVPGTVTGSLPGSAAETDASQTLTDNVTGGFNGDSSNYSYALVGSATGTYGTIQVNADGSYIYTLSAPVDGATADDGTNTVDNAESFTYEVTDEVGNTAQGTIQINIADDVPTAQVDVGAVNEGDILTVVADGVLGNDEFGADGAVLVGVRAAGGDTTTDAVGQVGTTIDGVYGTLNLSSDGGYTYTSTDNGIEGNETDVFVYTIEDGDGDLSTTTLTINLTDGGLVAGEADEVLVDEAALDLAQTGADLVPGTVTGSLPGSAAETDASQTLTDNVTGGFNGDSSNYSYALVGSATGTYGTIQVNADGSYIYTLSAPVDGATADDGTNTVDNAESFTYEVTDEVGNTAQGTIQINIADDVPTAQVDVGAVNEGDILTVVADGVLGNDEFGADGAVLVGVRAAGGDTTTDAVGQVGTTIDGVYGTLNLSSDGGYTYTSTDNGIEGNETDVFVYTIEDGDGDLSTTTLTINLTDGGLVAGEADEVLVDEAALDLAQTGADLVPGTVTGSLPGSAAETDASQTLTDNVTGGFNGDSSNYSYALVGSATGTYGTIQVNADGSYIYTLSAPVDGATADDGTNTVDNAESFTYEVTDEVGNTAQGTIQINIADDVPTAQVDVGAVNEGDILTVVADGVLGNDEFGADGAVLVGVRAAGGDTTTDAVGQVGTTIDGVYGTLNLSSDGGYTYTSTDNGIEGNETDVFVYTIEDGDGDLSTTTLTINLTDGGLVAGEADEVLVDEAALDLAQTGADLVPGTVTGSLPGSAAETDASQTLTDNVTGGFNGDSSNYSYALVGSATGTYGTIQVNADGSYIYTLSAPVDGATADDGTNTVDNAESFTYEVTDEVGNTAQGTIQINIADDVPTAQVDVGAVNEGDILTVVADGVLGNDEFGADGAVLVGVRAAGGDTTTDAVGQVGTTIDGVYGTLNLSSDGGYTYTSTDNGIEGNETDVFVYTIEDGDGDLSTTTLTINLTDGGLVAGEADEVLVDEAALDLAQTGADLVPGTVTGSLPGSAAETDASQTLTDNVTGGFNGDSSNYSYALVGSATGTYGTIQVNADGSYIYTLSAPVDGATADDGTNTVDNAESFTYEVTDEVGNTAQGTIQINIKDDVPTADLVAATVPVSLVLDETVAGTPSAAGDPNAGDELASADTADIGYAAVAGSLLFTDNSIFGADGPAASNAKVFSLVLVAAGISSGLVDTATGENILLTQIGDEILGKTETSDDLVFRISLDSTTGDVSVSQYRAIVHNDPLDHDESSSPESMDAGLVKLTLTVTDGDGDTHTDPDGIDLGLLIQFEDDGLTAGIPQNAILANELGNSLTASLDVTMGTDGPASTVPYALVGLVAGTLVLGTIEVFGAQETVTLTSEGIDLVWQDNGDGSWSAVRVSDSNEVFSITPNPDGTYTVALSDTYPLDGGFDIVPISFASGISGGNNQTEAYFNGTEPDTDGDNVPDDATLMVFASGYNADGTTGTINGSTQGLGVSQGNSINTLEINGVEQSEQLTLWFMEPSDPTLILDPATDGTPKEVDFAKITFDLLDGAKKAGDSPEHAIVIVHINDGSPDGRDVFFKVAGFGTGAGASDEVDLVITQGVEGSGTTGGDGLTEATAYIVDMGLLDGRFTGSVQIDGLFDHLHFQAETDSTDGVDSDYRLLSIQGFDDTVGNDISLNMAAAEATDGDGDSVLTGEFQVIFDAGNFIDGTDGDDVIQGNGVGDIINGLEGDDIIFGDGGDDTLTGGDGSDTFVWLAGETGTDTIGTTLTPDFTTGSGGDVLNLADLLQGETSDNLGDYLSIAYDGSDTTITAYVNGDGIAPVQEIILGGVDLSGSSLEDLLGNGNLVITETP